MTIENELNKLEDEMNLEEKFNELTKEIENAKLEINAKMKIAVDAIVEACHISEKYSIPFYANACTISQRYNPDSFKYLSDKQKTKIAEILKLEEYEISEAKDGYGWKHSDICY